MNYYYIIIIYIYKLICYHRHYKISNLIKQMKCIILVISYYHRIVPFFFTYTLTKVISHIKMYTFCTSYWLYNSVIIHKDIINISFADTTLITNLFTSLKFKDKGASISNAIHSITCNTCLFTMAEFALVSHFLVSYFFTVFVQKYIFFPISVS